MNTKEAFASAAVTCRYGWGGENIFGLPGGLSFMARGGGRNLSPVLSAL
jgi:hypothetical protein